MALTNEALMDAITLLAVAGTVITIILGILGLVGYPEPSCDPIPGGPVACGEARPEMHHIEPKERTEQRADSAMEQSSAASFVPRPVPAWWPQDEYQQQIQPLRSFQAAINGRPNRTLVRDDA
jgi:hypothetical protein